MKKIKIISILLSFLILTPNNLLASTTYYLDFKYILNESDAGKKAQNELKKKLNDGIKSSKKKEKSLQEEEKNNPTKKIISLKSIKKLQFQN